jgi:hypothetical protein
MHSRGKAVLEESVLGVLIGDLERGSEDGEQSTATPVIRQNSGRLASLL